MKFCDEGLIAKWKKPGYEKLCSTYVINTRNYNFGTTSICRVPRHSLGEDQVFDSAVKLIFELTGDFELVSEPIVFVSSSSSSKIILTTFHFSNFFPAMSDERAEKIFEQKRGETKTVGQLIVINIGVNPNAF